MDAQNWSSTDLIHDLSDKDVHEARELIDDGCQRLRSISDVVNTHFRFTVSFGAHKATTIYTISPVDCQVSGYSYQKVEGSYRLYCDREDVDSNIKSSIEVVYNVYIQANRQTFNHAE
jgi:hypothetical protein